MTTKRLLRWTRLDWDSDHFGVGIAILEDPHFTYEYLATQVESALAAGIQCFYWLTEAKEAMALPRMPSIKILDTRVLYVRLLPNGDSPSKPQETNIRAASHKDLPGLRALARDSHVQTRFHEDKSFPPSRASELYSKWIEKALSDSDGVVFVSGPSDRPTGYITCRLKPQANVTEIGLVAVSPSHQRSGLGHELVRAAIRWAKEHGADTIEVVTQGRNTAARALYERNDFTVKDEKTWVHIWLTSDRDFEERPLGSR
jgi:dTDP-4-amino-4,6-dideoxy-D-galactose acyltransferase